MLKPLADLTELSGITGQFNGPLFISLKRRGDEFRQSHCVQKARADPAGKGRSEAGQHRQPRPERIASRSVRVVGGGIQFRN